MNYEDLEVAVEQAWTEFFSSLAMNGVGNIDFIEDDLNRKDVFSKVFSAVIGQVEIHE